MFDGFALERIDTGEEHRVINARANREVGAVSVAKATVEQLERANRLLEREAAR